MQFQGRSVALFGRFSPGVRERLAREVVRLGGAVQRDFTRRSDLLVVGSLADSLVDSGALTARLQAASGRGVPVLGERAFAAALNGEPEGPPATLPLAQPLSQAGLSADDAAVLAAFDLIALKDGAGRFADAGVVRTAGELLAQGRTLGEAVRILRQARDLAPKGRHRIVLTPSGEAALKWDDGLTTLEGQGRLALDEDNASVDDLFEAAEEAEADGDLDLAARLYDLCIRADRKDALAAYNLANIRLAQGAHDEAVLGYQRALARDPRFAEARYNLAQALEAAGKEAAAASELARLVAAEPDYADAVFNLAQLNMKAGALAEAKALYERYLDLDPPADWAATARKAILYCTAAMAG
ncbi:MAG TPA: tetratricopeptide repeat protein [Caulobacteraceae bacterium]|nr:tetratricopeptide repeat protein [Caulobacteraceae bacterium]